MTLGLHPSEKIIMTLRLFSSDNMTLVSFPLRIKCDGMNAVGSGSGDLDNMEIVVLRIA